MHEAKAVKKTKPLPQNIKSFDSKAGMHPRNVHRAPYDFANLAKCSPELIRFVAPNRFGDDSIDFANAQAVKALNRALLKYFYAIEYWDIPEHYLCPPIPGRADYIHHLADLIRYDLSAPRTVRALDIGVGANVIYPLLGQRLYGWQFVGADIDAIALQSAKHIIDSNQGLAQSIDLRLQNSATDIFAGVIQAGEFFDLTLCNPPFHRSAVEAAMGSERKWRNLAKSRQLSKSSKPTKAKNKSPDHRDVSARPVLNFGGKSNELWCEGGERLFLERMIEQSEAFAQQCHWFTSLVSKEEHLPMLLAKLTHTGARRVKTMSMQQGQKQSRILAWSFFNE